MSKNTQIGELINYISVNESGDVVLSNGHLVATQNYVSTAVANLVDAAPATLDTLNELAAALGDDPNFATTVTNSIGGKLSLTGGTLTGALNGTSATFTGAVTSDDLILTAGTLFGAGNTGFSNRLSDTTLYLQMPATGFNITDNALNTRFILSSTGEATFSRVPMTNQASYNYQNIRVTSGFGGGYTGAKVQSLLAGYDGSLYGVDIGYSYDGGGAGNYGYSLRFATNDDLSGNPIERLRINSTGAATFTGPALPMVIASINATELYCEYRYNTSTVVGYIGNGTGLMTGGGDANFGIRAQNSLVFSTLTNERMRITSGGNVLIGTTSDNGNKLQVSGGASFSNAISPNGGVFALGDVLTTTGRLLVSNGSQGANTETASLLLGNRGYFSTSDIGAARISAVATGANWYNGTALAFYTNPGPDVTSTGAVERMRIASNGSVKIRSNSSSIFTTSKYYSVNNNSTSDIFFDINSEFGIGNGGYVLVEITLSAYGNAGSGGGVYKWIAGGYSGHTIALTGYHKYEVIANTIGGNVSSISPYNPTYNVYGVTIVNSAAYVVVGVMEIRVTTTY